MGQHYLKIHQHSSFNTQLQPQPPDGASSRLSQHQLHHHHHHHHHEVNVLGSQSGFEPQTQRKEHSHSPSDGMILTASGLAGLISNGSANRGGHRSRDNSTILQQAQSNNSENQNSNQVVIVDGLTNDEDVYLTTS